MHDHERNGDREVQTMPEPVPTDLASNGEDVMSLLAGVEQQFQRLRSVQAAHADEVRTLAERSTGLDRWEDELQGRQEALEAEAVQVREASDSLLELRRELDERRVSLDEEGRRLDEARDALALEREELAASRADARDELAGREDALRQREDALRRREEALGDHEERLEQADRRLDELGQELDRRRTELDQAREQASGLTAEVEALRAELEQARADAASNEQSATELLRRTEQARAELATSIETLGVERDELGARLEAAQQREAETAARLRELEGAVTSGDEARRHLETELTQREQRIDRLEQELAESTEKLQTACRKLAEFSQLLDGQVPQLERSAALAAELESQQRRIEQLTRQLEEAGSGGDVDDRDERVELLNGQVRQLQRCLEEAESTHRAQLEALTAAEQAGTAEREALERRLEEMREQHVRLSEALEQAVRDQAGPDAAEADAIEGLRRQVVEAHERTEQLEQQLTCEQEAKELVLADGHRQRAELTAEVTRLQEALDSAVGGDRAGDAEDPAAEAGGAGSRAHLRRRRDRLARLRRGLRERRQVARAGADAQAARELSTEKLQLEEVRKLLVASEKMMVRKWAKNRSVLTACALVMLLALNVSGAWFAASQLFPPTHAATATLVPDGVDGLSAAEQVEWARWHTALLHEEDLHVAVAERLHDRLLLGLDSPSAVRTMIVKELAVEANGPHGLALTLQRPDAQEACTALEVLSGTLVNESRRRAVERGAIPSVTVPDLGWAGRGAIAVQPFEDQRLAYAGPIFGGLCVITLALVGVAYSQWKSGSSGVLDEYAELFATSATTSPTEFEDTLKPLVWE